MNIFLIGYMGSGKSKTGEALAKALAFSFLDTDQLIEQQTGKSIRDLFYAPGPEEFRLMEKNLIRKLTEKTNQVISTGGGLPCYFDNMDWMNKNGITVYLEANAGLLFHRLVRNRTGRPLIENISDVDLMDQIQNHLMDRVPIYAQAQIKVNAASLDVKGLTEKIKNLQEEKST
ncbi:MAG TPA: shikimate kinase [Bacteroidia bacterium]|mgnify:CR=1 FL=1|nr:shikimate kinase [Bacteroidia bacterium]